ncbi:MAG: DEAD/DEAH box helicase family protein, partial [Clostridiales bacterium]|nr:DEAD/DEAH box helicase family protein [Clostridiales bacterium]
MRTEATINHFFTPDVMRNVLEEYLGFDCVVCDEAHYFLSDSTFNNRTWISYAWVMMLFKNKVMIFISATIKDVTDYIKNDISEYSFDKTPWY